MLRRAKFSPDTLIGMEACPVSQWLARRLAAMGHDARILPARSVQPYVQSNKTDAVAGAGRAILLEDPSGNIVELFEFKKR